MTARQSDWLKVKECNQVKEKILQGPFMRKTELDNVVLHKLSLGSHRNMQTTYSMIKLIPMRNKLLVPIMVIHIKI